MALMMWRISEKAALSEIYTNPSVRKTCITKLSDHGVENHITMATPCHKKAKSLAAYNRPTEKQQKRTAVIVDGRTDEAVHNLLELSTAEQLRLLESNQPITVQEQGSSNQIFSEERR